MKIHAIYINGKRAFLFNANASNVHIRISSETRGFGSMEEAVNTATCEIEINK